VNPDATDDTGNTPLHFAADLGQARVARALLDAHADPNAKNNFGRSPLNNAEAQSYDSDKISAGKQWLRRMFDGHIDPLDALPLEDLPKREAPAQMTGPNRRGSGSLPGLMAAQETPLPMDYEQVSLTQTHAVSTQPSLLESLGQKLVASLSQMTSMSISQETVISPQNISQPKQVTQVSHPLISEASELPFSPFSSCNQDVLRRCIKNDDVAGVEVWLDKVRKSFEGPISHRRDYVMSTVSCCEEGEEGQDARVALSGLHCAALHGKVNCLRVLLETNVNPNAINDQGSTPLHLAVDLDRHEAVQLLLEAKADPLQKNNFGRTPHQVREGRANQSRSGLDDASIDQGMHRNTATVVYRGTAALEGPFDCNICRERFRDGDQLRILPCLHKYHAACIDRWLIQNRTCPTCKFSLDSLPVMQLRE